MAKRSGLLIGFTALLMLAGCQQNSGTAQQQSVQTQSVEVEQYSAETFFDTVSIFGSSINHDGTAVLVTSDADGIFNAYRYPLDGSAPVQLTDSDSNATFGVSWFPDDDRFLVTADQNGNELNHLYVVNADGSQQDLTPGEELKASFLGWHDDDRHFFVMTNERDPKAFDIYQYSIDDFSRTLLFTNEQAMEIGAVSGDGRYVALAKIHSNADDDIYLLNLTSSDAEPVLITGHEGNVSHSVYTFGPDNQALYYGSNEGSEFASARRYEIAGDSHTEVYSDDWDVSFLYFSDSGRYRVIGVNADAQTQLKITDTTTSEPVVMPAIPAGDLRGVNFSDDDTQMVFYINSDVAPSNLYHWRLGSQQVTQLSETLNQAINAEHLVSSEVVRFDSFDGVQVPGLLYQPHQASASNKVPAVIFIHGGPGGQTRKGYRAIIQHLVNHGYAIFGVNNRGSSGYGKAFYHLDDKRHGEDDLQDIVYSKKYLQSLDWVDGERIAVMGGSYGGYLTVAAMAFTDEFDAGINIFGVTNWVRTLESIPPWWEAFRQALYDELGDPATDKERLYRISPLFHADKIKQPVLVVQGANDPRVLQVESDEMVEAIRANEVPVEYVLFDDEGHGFRNKENRITAQNAYLDFLNQYL